MKAGRLHDLCVTFQTLSDREIQHLHLEQLHPALLFGLDALLHLRVGLDAHAPEGGHVLLAVLGFGLGVGQFNDAQAGVPQTAGQRHQLRQREGHHGGLRPACGEAGIDSPPFTVIDLYIYV